MLRGRNDCTRGFRGRVQTVYTLYHASIVLKDSREFYLLSLNNKENARLPFGFTAWSIKQKFAGSCHYLQSGRFRLL